MIEKNNIIKLAALPLVLIISTVIFIVIYKMMGLPATPALIKIARSALDEHGYPLVFVSSIIETIPPVNLYFPGSVVIVVSVAHSKTGAINPLIVLSLIELAFVIAYLGNYFIGRYGVYRYLLNCGLGPSIDNAKIKIERHGLSWLRLTCIHPNLGAISSIASGILRIPLRRFFLNMTLAVLIWNTFFGIVVYVYGEAVFEMLDLRWLLLLLFVWFLLNLAKGFYKKHKEMRNELAK